MGNNTMNSMKGFTLIELAIVLVIIGLLVGSFVGTISSRIETTRYSETEDDLKIIKQALLGYVYKNGFMPCPDTDGDGVSEINCLLTPFGNVPWDTLGLAAGDAWHNRYEYWVDAANYSVPFDLDTNTVGGQILTRSNDGSALVQLTSSVVVVILSRGKNGLGAVGVDGAVKQDIPTTGHGDEDENGNGNGIFVSRSPTYKDDTTDVGTFDDQINWISEFVLKAKMVEAGKLP